MSMKSILIVDDEKPLATALSLKLSKEGFTVHIAGNGKECLDLFEKHPIDCILLDLMMPEMNGFEVMERLKQSKKKFPTIIVLSNLSQEEDVSKVKALGACEYFVKSNTPIRDIVTYVKTLPNEPPDR